MTDRVRSIRPPGIRLQLMFWYISIFALLLLLFSVIFYLALQDALQKDIDADLQLRIREITVGITNDNGTTSAEEIQEDAPKLDPAVLGNITISGLSSGNQTKIDSSVNYRSFVRILDVKGKTIYASPVPQNVPLPPASVTEALHGTAWTGTIFTHDGQSMRLYSTRLMFKGILFGAIQVGESLTPMNNILFNILIKLLFITPFILLGGAIGSYWLTRRAFAPIRTLTGIAQEISAGDLDRLVPVPRPKDEVQYLALTFNQMIARLHKAFLQQRRFVADASHELRTPVAAIRSMTDVALAESSQVDESHVPVLRHVNAQAERLGELIRDLLLLARSDEGQVPLDHELVQLDQLVSDVIATLAPLAVERSIQLQILKLEPATVQGDPSRLVQCIMNLLDNALTYTHTGGEVTVRVEVKENTACIIIQDTGVGIAPQHLPHIFERFYRADPARSQKEGKSGLGLSIVDWIVHAHGGSIAVESSEGHGSTFSVSLPLAHCASLKNSLSERATRNE